MMLITIIIAVRNGEKNIQRCIDSVFNQTFVNKELIIIDGLSNDDTVEIIQRNADKISYWETARDKGIYDAWNKGVKHSRGDWITFVGVDDYFIDEFVLESLEKDLSYAESKDILYVYGKVGLFLEGKKCIVNYVNPDWSTLKQKIKKGFFLMHSGSFHHRNLFVKHGMFDNKFKIAGDYNFLLKELKNCDAYYVEKKILIMTLGGVSSNPKYKMSFYKEVVKAWLNNNMKGIPNAIIIDMLSYLIFRVFVLIFGRDYANNILNYYRKIKGKPPDLSTFQISQ